MQTSAPRPCQGLLRTTWVQQLATAARRRRERVRNVIGRLPRRLRALLPAEVTSRPEVAVGARPVNTRASHSIAAAAAEETVTKEAGPRKNNETCFFVFFLVTAPDHRATA